MAPAGFETAIPASEYPQTAQPLGSAHPDFNICIVICGHSVCMFTTDVLTTDTKYFIEPQRLCKIMDLTFAVFRLFPTCRMSFRVIHGRLLCVRRFLWLIQTFKDPVLGFKQNQLLNKEEEGEVYRFCGSCLIQQTPYRMA